MTKRNYFILTLALALMGCDSSDHPDEFRADDQADPIYELCESQTEEPRPSRISGEPGLLVCGPGLEPVCGCIDDNTVIWLQGDCKNWGGDCEECCANYGGYLYEGATHLECPGNPGC